MIENLLEALQNLNYDDAQTLDLTKEEDNKKFKSAIQLIKDYKKEIKNDSIMSLLSNLIDDDLLNKAEEYADNVLEESKEEDVKEDVKNQCSICEKEYCDNCPFFEDKEEDSKIIRPSELLDNTEVKLQIHRLINEYCEEYINPYVSNDIQGKELANNAYAGLFEFACWIFNKK